MSARPRICLIEDDPIMGESLCVRFDLEGFAVDWHRTGREGQAALAKHPYIAVISDIRLPDVGGDELWIESRRRGLALPPTIFITGYGSIDRAVELLKLGATDYVTKPFDIEQLVLKVRSTVPAPASSGDAGEALGVSPSMQAIGRVLPRLARHAGTLLITGESGVGKERVAIRFDHLARDSDRCPFVPVNCGAVTESLFESELFGHEKGAFTGAVRARKGLFEQADCGTLFLDEIGELPLPLQVKLLRAIQERRFLRVGGEQPVSVDLRLICATNQDLKALVAQGRFREDLYYRINAVNLRIPPLRERPEDILWLARGFLEEFAREHRTDRMSLHPAAEQALLDYPWPGNVRELKHTIERACIIAPGPLLRPEDLFADDLARELSPSSGPTSLEGHLQACERAYIRRTLDANEWHVARTAQALGISRKNLWEKMKKLAIHEREP
ncbi:MAG: sigma-54 dependent transcriptional regulator [Burkholderiales bacterium]